MPMKASVAMETETSAGGLEGAEKKAPGGAPPKGAAGAKESSGGEEQVEAPAPRGDAEAKAGSSAKARAKERKRAKEKEERQERLSAKAAAEAEEALAVEQAAVRLRSELVWCIAQLDAGLAQPDACEQQVKESLKVRKLLLSQKVPLVRKRHTMNLVFGDYRSMMESMELPDELRIAAEEALDHAANGST